jgi:putative nucleotidyltransferase with HDIG domain
VRRPPRLVARTLAVTFFTVAAVLAVVFIVLIVDARERVRAAESEKLQVSEQVFSGLEAIRQREQLATIAMLAENPTLKAALDTYLAESALAGLLPDQALRDTVARELEKLAALTAADVVAIVDDADRVFASAGPARDRWAANLAIENPAAGLPSFQSVIVLPGGAAYRVTGAALTLTGDRDIGWLMVGRNLDANYALELSTLASAGIVITVNGEVVARTVPEAVTRDLVATGYASGASQVLNGEEYAVRSLIVSGPARVLALTSIDAAARAATRAALLALGTTAFGAFVLTAFVSLWLARTLTDPINRVASDITMMAATGDRTRALQATGTSREIDALTEAFNTLMQGLAAAESESRIAYLGAIRALAATLDARDPYTAGHSERVSTLSVLIGRELRMSAAELDVLRLGALLHDIGKIGVSDEILRKPTALTPEEFEQIKRHPGLGARILRQVPFLAPHLPIVELHHERPDGLGYPYGLRGDDIPLAARIVHVADAFDAMTSARAYRRALARSEAIAELRRHAGIQFDVASVDALLASLPAATIAPEPALQELLGRQPVFS